MNNIILKLIITFLLIVNSILAQNISEGIKLIRNQKNIKAKIFFTEMLNSSNNSVACFYLGDILFNEEKVDSAKMYFGIGTRIDPNEALNYAGLVKCNLYLDEKLDAKTNLSKALELANSKNEKVLLVLAEAHIQEKIKNYNQALVYINDALKINPKSIDALLLQGEIFFIEGNGTDAIKCCENILDLDKNNPEALKLKAKVYNRIEKKNEAIILLEKVINNYPEFAPVYKELSEIYADLKNYSKAVENYSKYINYSELTPAKQKRYASVLYINKDYTLSISILKDLLEKGDNDASTIRIIAYSYLRQDSIVQSKSYFEKLFELKLSEYQISDFENYAELLFKSGEELSALNYFKKVYELDSTRTDVLGKISVIYYKNKKWDGVISTLKDKRNLTAQEYFDLSKAYIFKGDANITNALQFCSGKIKTGIDQLDKIRILLLYYQAKIAEAKNDVKKIELAKNDLHLSVESVITTNQNSNWSKFKSEWVLLIDSTISTEYSSADTILNILLNKTPNLAIAYIWQARVKVNFDPETKLALAKPFYEKFIELSINEKEKYKKELIESYSYLGYYYYLQKDYSKSKENWLQVSNLDPENKQAIDVLKQLK